MRTTVVFRGMAHSDIVEDYFNSNLGKLERVISSEREPISLRIVLTAARVHHHHTVELLLNSPNYDLLVKHEGPELYPGIEHVIDVMTREVVKEKGKLIDRRDATSIRDKEAISSTEIIQEFEELEIIEEFEDEGVLIDADSGLDD